MEATFKIMESNRVLYLKFLEGYSLEQLNKIPQGLSNNLIWNIGHVLVSQQGLLYRLSGLPINVSAELNDKYKNGSRPDGNASQAEVDLIKELWLSSVEQIKADYDAGAFVNYNEYQTQTGFHLANFKDAIAFNNYHHGLHLGIMMQIRKFL